MNNETFLHMISALSDDELETIRSLVSQEYVKRLSVKIQNGAYLFPLEEERDLFKSNQRTLAVLAYSKRAHTNVIISTYVLEYYCKE